VAFIYSTCEKTNVVKGPVMAYMKKVTDATTATGLVRAGSRFSMLD
jgi:hypothetical protein